MPFTTEQTADLHVYLLALRIEIIVRSRGRHPRLSTHLFFHDIPLGDIPSVVGLGEALIGCEDLFGWFSARQTSATPPTLCHCFS